MFVINWRKRKRKSIYRKKRKSIYHWNILELGGK